MFFFVTVIVNDSCVAVERYSFPRKPHKIVMTDESLEILKKELGGVPFLPLGDSDLVLRSDEVLALGYPLGQKHPQRLVYQFCLKFSLYFPVPMRDI